MFNIPFFRRTSDTFGLDIGSSAVKVVQLHGSSLIGLGVASLPPDAIAEGTIKDPPSVVEAIKDAVGRAAVGSKEAAIGVSGRELIIKKVQIPEVPVKELRDAVQLEAEHHIPFAIDEVFLDYHVVGRHDGAMDLILVAVKKSKVVEYVGVVEEAGLNAVVVDVDASVMKTNVLRAGTPIFARDIPFGGNNYTHAIAQHLKIPFDQAESAKLGRDVGVSWESLVPALESVSRELSLEVQRTFDYFASTADSERIGKIVLAGGCAQLPGLTDYLSSTWGIPVELAQPFARIDVGGGHSEVVGAAGPSLAVAVGLALRQPGDKNE